MLVHRFYGNIRSKSRDEKGLLRALRPKMHNLMLGRAKHAHYNVWWLGAVYVNMHVKIKEWTMQRKHCTAFLNACSSIDLFHDSCDHSHTSAPRQYNDPSCWCTGFTEIITWWKRSIHLDVYPLLKSTVPHLRQQYFATQKTPSEKFVMHVALCDHKVLILKRPSTELLAWTCHMLTLA